MKVFKKIILYTALLAFAVSVVFNVPREFSHAQTSPQVRVVFGRVDQYGNILGGSHLPKTPSKYDFSVSHGSTGSYSISFDSSDFSNTPALVVNPASASHPADIDSVGRFSAFFHIGRVGAGNQDDYFSFIAVGLSSNPRNDLAYAFGSFMSSYGVGASNAGSGNWTSSPGTGSYSVSFKAGVFSSPPTVVAMGPGAVDCVSGVSQSPTLAYLYEESGNCETGVPRTDYTGQGMSFIAVGENAAQPDLVNISEGTFGYDGTIGAGSTGDLQYVYGSLAAIIVCIFLSPTWRL